MVKILCVYSYLLLLTISDHKWATSDHKELMNFCAYKQVVQSATSLPSGSLLDHIYLKQTDYYKLKV